MWLLVTMLCCITSKIDATCLHTKSNSIVNLGPELNEVHKLLDSMLAEGSLTKDYKSVIPYENFDDLIKDANKGCLKDLVEDENDRSAIIKEAKNQVTIQKIETMKKKEELSQEIDQKVAKQNVQHFQYDFYGHNESLLKHKQLEVLNIIIIVLIGCCMCIGFSLIVFIGGFGCGYFYHAKVKYNGSRDMKPYIDSV